MTRTVSILLIIILCAAPLMAQEPIPYEPDEFPLWLRDVRRAEAILFGVIPLTVLYATIAYDIYRFSNHAAQTGVANPNYLPSMLTSTHAPFSQEDEQIIVWTALGLAAGVAIADLIIHLIRAKKENKGLFEK